MQTHSYNTALIESEQKPKRHTRMNRKQKPIATEGKKDKRTHIKLT